MMLKSKRNLFQRVRIMMVAIVAILGVGSAFAMKPAHQTGQKWGVVGTSGAYYIVAPTSAGLCDGANTVCSVTSTATPDSQNRILKTQATQTPDTGTFHLDQ